MTNNMKAILLQVIFLSISHATFSQISEPREITPKILESIKIEIEKKIPRVRKQLENDGLNSHQIEFYIDTFRIVQLATKKIEINYTTLGINESMYELSESYDILLNKYYKKLLKKLKTEDQKKLINTQKAWIIFRDLELKFIQTIAESEYSGGGTMQTSIAIARYQSIVENRVNQIFDYFDSILME